METLLEGCPDLRVLLTGRQPLSLLGEASVVLGGLEVPSADASVEELVDNEAVALFMDRVTLQTPTFTLDPSNAPAVRDLVRALHGWPLALELAAAQVWQRGASWLESNVANLRELRARARGRPARHQSVHDSLVWTWEALDATVRDALLQLSVFRGGFTTQSADAVVDGVTEMGQLLHGLREGGLVFVSAEGPELRFEMLAPIREWVEAKRGVDEALAERHLVWAARHCQWAMAREQRGVSVAQLQAEASNLEQAWHTAVATRSAEGTAQIALGLAHLAWWYGSLEAEYDRLRAALELNEDSIRLWLRAGMVANRLTRLEEAEAHVSVAVDLAGADDVPANLRAAALLHLAVVLGRRGSYDRADALFEEACALAPAGSPSQMAALSNWSVSLNERGHANAVPFAEQAVQICEQNDDPFPLPGVLYNAASAYMKAGRHQLAQRSLERALQLADRQQTRVLASIRCLLAQVWQTVDASKALQLLDQAADDAHRLGEPRILIEAHARLATLHASSGDLGAARGALDVAVVALPSPSERHLEQLVDEARGALGRATERPARARRGSG